MRVAEPERLTEVLPLGRPMSPLFVLPAVAFVLLIVRPVLESLILPELSTILVLDLPDTPLLVAEVLL